MDKKELKKAIDDVVAKIKTNSKDSHFADSLVDRLLSLKGQYDVEPTRIHIEEKDVVKEYDFDASSFVKCKQCIIYHAKSGMDIIVKPSMKLLYEHLDILLGMKEDDENLSEELKKSYDSLYSATNWILNSLIYATIDDTLFFGIANDIFKRFDDYVQSKEATLQEETPKENADFEILNKAINDIVDDKDA